MLVPLRLPSRLIVTLLRCLHDNVMSKPQLFDLLFLDITEKENLTRRLQEIRTASEEGEVRLVNQNGCYGVTAETRPVKSWRGYGFIIRIILYCVTSLVSL